MFSINEVASTLNLSKQTIYKRINSKEFEDFVIANKGKKYLTLEGVNKLRTLQERKLNMENLKDKLEELKATLERQKLEIESLRVENDRTRFENKGLLGEIEELNENLRVKNVEKESLRIEYERLKNENAKILKLLEEDIAKQNTMIKDTLSNTESLLVFRQENYVRRSDKYKKKSLFKRFRIF